MIFEPLQMLYKEGISHFFTAKAQYKMDENYDNKEVLKSKHFVTHFPDK